MLALISFGFMVFGCINWLSIGLLQFDILAGIFGSQANVFSRLFYIAIGAFAIYMVVVAIKNKGKINCNKEECAKQGKKSDDMLS